MNRRKDFYIEIEHPDEKEESNHIDNSVSNSEKKFSKSNYSYSEIEKLHKKSKPKRKKSPIPNTHIILPKNFKLYIIILLLVILYFTYNNILLFFLSMLNSNPQVYSIYLELESHIRNNTIQGLFIMAILGSIFFLSLPSEALLIYYLSSTDYNFVVIIFLMMLGNMVGFIFNYIFGLIIGERALKFLFKKSYTKHKNFIDKYGGYFLFFGNVLPGPVETLSIFYGAFKYNFKTYLYLCFIGRLTKLIIILILYFLFWDQLLIYYELLMENLLVLKDVYTI